MEVASFEEGQLDSLRAPDEMAASSMLQAFDLTNTCIRALDGTIYFWSQGNVRLYGWSSEEALGKITHSLLQTRFPGMLDRIQSALIRNGSWRGELVHRTKSGRDIWVVSNWVLQRDQQDRISSVVEVNNEVADWKESSRYLASIVATPEDAIIAKNLDGVITSWNAGAEKLFGYAASEVIGQSILQLFPPELLDEEQAILASIQRGQHIQHYETIRLTKSGARIPVSLAVSPIVDSDGNIVGASKVARDLSLKKALEESERRRRIAVEAGGVGVWSYTVASQTPHCDARCKELFGLSPTDVLSCLHAIFCLIHPEDVARVRREFQSTIDGNQPFDSTFRVVDKAGSVRWVEAKGRATSDAGHVISHINGAMVDVTDRKLTEVNLERQIREHTAQLRAVNAELENFVYVASHDLKAPLRSIDDLAKWLEEDLEPHLTPDTRDTLMLLHRRVRRMEKLLDDLLEYARVGRKTNAMSGEFLLGSELVADTLSMLPVGSFDIKINPNFASVRVPRMPLQQILMNLIGNAIKHHHRNHGLIELSLQDSGDFQQFTVSDDGPGIPAQFHELVFKMFQTLKPRDQVEGSGMGLAIVRKTVEAAGGTLSLISSEGMGSSFTFTLPKQPATEKAAV